MFDDALRRSHDAVKPHLPTLLLVAPELLERDCVPDEVRQAFAVSREGNLPDWTGRVAHGVIDFLLDCFARCGRPGATILFVNVDCADPTDMEFLAIFLRRAEPAVVRLCIEATGGHVADGLAAALKLYATRVRSATASLSAAPVPAAWARWLSARGLDRAGAAALWAAASTLCQLGDRPPRSTSLEPFLDSVLALLPAARRKALARTHVNADGTRRDVLSARAYALLPAQKRKAMHLARAKALAARGEPTLSLGAIPFHREQAGDGVEALLAAASRCMQFAYYEAALDWSIRGQRMLAATLSSSVHAELTRNMLFALLLLGRHREVETLCTEVIAANDDPALAAHATYAMAILNARLYERSRQDYDAARTWIEKSRHFTRKLPPTPRRAVNLAFLTNTLALVELRVGKLELAKKRLRTAIRIVRRDAPELYRLESLILWHNMARLHVAAGRAERAVADLTTMIAQEPGDSAAWLDRGLIHQRAGRFAAALADYDAAIRWGPPSLPAHFNRAQVLAALGRIGEALAEYDRVMVLDPGFADARLNRGCLFYENGDYGAACRDVTRGLALRSDDARLLCLAGLLAMVHGDTDTALDDFTRSIRSDPKLADAWANRATILVRLGRLREAVDDLSRSLALREHAAALYNRGCVFEALRQWRKAEADYARALALGGSAERIAPRQARCLAALAPSRKRKRSGPTP